MVKILVVMVKDGRKIILRNVDILVLCIYYNIWLVKLIYIDDRCRFCK